MGEALPKGLCRTLSLKVEGQLCSVYVSDSSFLKKDTFPWQKIVADILSGNGLVESVVKMGRGGIFFLSGGRLPFPIVVRQYRHGGLGRFLSGARFFSKRRFLNELKLHKVVDDLGLATLQALAVIVVQKADISFLVNGYYVTRRLSESVNFAEFLVKVKASDRLKIACEIGTYLRKLHEHGIFYTDMHIKNILVGSRGEVFFIDFDKSEQCKAPLSNYRRRINLYRFLRSIEKYCHRGGKWLEVDRAAFLIAYEPDFSKYTKLYQKLVFGLSWRRLFYKFGWWLNRS